jgi:hypothetical protein
VLAVEKVVLNWATRLRLASGREHPLQSGDAFTLAAGSRVRLGGHLGRLETDLEVRSGGGREVRCARAGTVLLDNASPQPVRAKARLQLDRSNIVRLPDGQTGLLQVASRAEWEESGELDWGGDSHWLARFPDGVPLVLLRRGVFAELQGVVHESCAGVAGAPAGRWRVVLGVHDCFLDGSIPFRAGRSSLRGSPDYLMGFLREFGDTDSLREEMAREFSFAVDAADVRLSPTRFAGAGLRGLLRQVATDGSLNSELLSVGHKVPCWTQLGAYYRTAAAWPWEVTREVYFTFVDVSYRQHAGG